MASLTQLTAELATMKEKMVQRLTDQGVSGVTTSTPMQDIVDDYAALRALNYETTTITENGSYVAPNGKTGYNNFVVNVPDGGPATHKKYALLDRVYEDVNGDSIGTVVGFHYDANDVEYAIVALDAAYRLASGQYTSATGAITGLPNYSNQTLYSARETATFNCDKILEWVAGADGRSSSAVSHCRAQSFTVAGESYAGQLPTLMELLKVFEWRDRVNALDPTAAANPNLTVPSATTCWSSSQNSSTTAWCIGSPGNVTDSGYKTYNYFVLPILEIPNA